MRTEWHEQDDRRFMLMPIYPEPTITGHGFKTQAWTSQRVLKYLFSGFRFTFENIYFG
jgi:hypothetical protein